MKIFITQILLISSLSLSIAYAGGASARDQKGGRPPMSDEMKEAFDACHEEVGMPDRESGRPPEGERPTKEQHEAMKTCLKGKGFTPPEHGGKGRGRGGDPLPEQSGENQEGEE